MHNNMEDAEVRVEPTPITAGEDVKIKYDGLLSKTGASKVYLHAGVGMEDTWRDVTDIEMKHGSNGDWIAQLRINTTERFNFCFKDCADNWDNNNGHNWSFEVHDGMKY